MNNIKDLILFVEELSLEDDVLHEGKIKNLVIDKMNKKLKNKKPVEPDEIEKESDIMKEEEFDVDKEYDNLMNEEMEDLKRLDEELDDLESFLEEYDG